jgi:hypothetical protein
LGVTTFFFLAGDGAGFLGDALLLRDEPAPFRFATFFFLAGEGADFLGDVLLLRDEPVPFRFATFFFFVLAGDCMVFPTVLSDEPLLDDVTEPTIRLPVTTAVPAKVPTSLDTDPITFEGSPFCRVAIFSISFIQL